MMGGYDKQKINFLFGFVFHVSGFSLVSGSDLKNQKQKQKHETRNMKQIT